MLSRSQGFRYIFKTGEHEACRGCADLAMYGGLKPVCMECIICECMAHTTTCNMYKKPLLAFCIINFEQIAQATATGGWSPIVDWLIKEEISTEQILGEIIYPCQDSYRMR